MTIDMPELLRVAKELRACVGNYSAAYRAMQDNNLDEFIVICRGNYDWCKTYLRLTWDCLGDGVGHSYHPNGQMAIDCVYKDGTRHGAYKEYCEDGTLIRECTYKDDILYGVCKAYPPNGAPAREYIYK